MASDSFAYINASENSRQQLEENHKNVNFSETLMESFTKKRFGETKLSIEFIDKLFVTDIH
jgi:hypothetical protein